MDRNNLLTSILQSFQSLSLSATTIDFGRDFARNKTPEEIVATINHFLQHRTSNKVDKFHLYFCSSEKFIADIENWLAYVIEKGVEDVNIDFSMELDIQKEEEYLSLPKSLFEAKALTNLSSLLHPDFSPLKSLSLAYVNVSGNKLQQLMANCPLLDRLSIINCLSNDTVVLSSQRLQKLTVVNPNIDIYQLEISAPNLESFIYFGVHIFGDSYSDPTPTDTFTDISSLSDAFIFAVESSEPEHDFIKLVYDLRHVKILTVCSYTLWRVKYCSDDEKLPILLQNLRELQLIMCNSTMSSEDLAAIYAFFRHCPSPFIEKLFIKLPNYPGDMNNACYNNEEVEDPSDVSFNNLKVIKISDFKGRKAEMRLVGFLLQKAVYLETLVLVWPPESAEESMDMEPSNSGPETATTRINDLVNLQVQLSLLPKAASQARILLCEHSEDLSLTPTHTEYFEEY